MGCFDTNCRDVGRIVVAKGSKNIKVERFLLAIAVNRTLISS